MTRFLTAMAVFWALGCSIVTDPGDFSYIEANPSETCTADGDCLADAFCPKLADDMGGLTETQSRCYLNCEGDASVCDEAAYPYCFSAPSGKSVCLAALSVIGSFRCSTAGEQTPGQQLKLTLADGSRTALDQCRIVINRDTNMTALIFNGRPAERDDIVYEVTFLVLDRQIESPGIIETATGQVLQVERNPDAGASDTELFHLVGFFPGTATSTAPPLSPPLIAVLETGDQVGGNVVFQGLAYDADVETP